MANLNESGVKKVHTENEGYSVVETGLVSNLKGRREIADEKTDNEINIIPATNLFIAQINEQDPEQDPVIITTLELNEGEFATVVVTAVPEMANCPRLAWYSSNQEVAVVSDMMEYGMYAGNKAHIAAVSEGDAVITVADANGELKCELQLSVVAAGPEPEPIEVGSKYAFVSYSDDAEPVEYAHGTVEVLSTTKKLAKIVVLTNEPDDPQEPWVGREFYVDRDIEVGDGNKYPLYTNTSKTVVPGVVVEITEKVEEA